MTTHEAHDHPNTKAGRAACRRAALNGSAPKTREEGSKERHPAGKKRSTPKAKKDKIDNRPALPHEFDDDTERPGFCYVCKLTKRARVHDAGPSDLGMLFNFGGN